MKRMLPSLKTFVRGSCIDGEQADPNPSASVVSGTLSGLEARQAYEGIVSNCTDTPHQNVDVECKVDRSTITFHEEPEIVLVTSPATAVLKSQAQAKAESRPGLKDTTLVSLMKHAEQNDCKKVMYDLNNDISLLNAVDQFGWSPLMVASCAGALEVVELLLRSGANTRLRDRSGATCISLARKRGHHHIIDAIKSFSPKILEQEVARPSASPKHQLCTACNIRVKESSSKSHLTSTVHQLNKCMKGCRTYYSIPQSNRGYQMMLNSGWSGEGLGPSGTGTKYPPKTTLKRDRKGLGVSKQPARITHFQSNDLKAIASESPHNRSSKGHQNKAQLNQQIQKEKLKERSLRWQLN